MEVLVVGGGASGLMAAIAASGAGARVTVLEGMDKPGKKLLVTGNGRCNLTNCSIRDGKGYHTRKPEVADAVLEAFTAEDTMHFFETLGLLLKNREGGLVYPYSDQAQSVVDALLTEAKQRKVKIKCREKVISVKKQKDGFLVQTEGWQYRADRVILACGGKAAAVTGSDGSGYELAGMLGHSVIPVLPALVPLTVKEGFVKSLEGVRSRARLTLYDGENIICREEGELQWTSYGISGIVVFQLSGPALTLLKKGKHPEIEVDLLPDFSLEELEPKVTQRIIASEQELSFEGLLSGFYHGKVFKTLLREWGGKASDKVEEQTALEFIAYTKKLKLHIRGSRSFDQAQVCSGGVDLSEIHWDTMESRKVKGLYFAGELLDVDGPCGGFNLQWAWASGYLAGIHGGKGAS